ncbi:MAG: lipid-A-disaccharide synthase [Desulfobacteraceae bacterium]|jgi:lipid-A-disaccharide synthase
MRLKPPKTIVMVAGEASGDLHGARVIRSLRKRHDDIYVCGAGGSAMRAEGARLIVDANELSVMGFTAIFSKAPQILNAIAKLKKLMLSLKPDLVILIDFPDFNIHLAASAKRAGIPVLYYISPTVWAWRPKRVFKIKQRVDHMAVILPFEESIYEKHGIPVTFVGHPLLDDVENPAESSVIRPDSQVPTIALMPGSRHDEVQRLLPTMLEASKIIQRNNNRTRILVSCAPSIDSTLINEIINKHGADNIRTTQDKAGQVFKRCHLAVAASGTVSLEAAIYATPTIIVYEVSELSYRLGKLMVDVPHIGMANLIAGKRVLPELIQKEVTAENIARIAMNLLADRDACCRMENELKDIRQLLGKPGASDRVAEIACRLMECDCAI